jgi:hypothetical protein
MDEGNILKTLVRVTTFDLEQRMQMMQMGLGNNMLKPKSLNNSIVVMNLVFKLSIDEAKLKSEESTSEIDSKINKISEHLKEVSDK